MSLQFKTYGFDDWNNPSFHFPFNGLKDFPYIRSNLERLMPGDDLFIITDDNNCLGICFGVKEEEGLYYIRHFEVSEKYRGKGIGSSFYKEIEKEVKTYDIDEIYLKFFENDAKKFWFKQGFEFIENFVNALIKEV